MRNEDLIRANDAIIALEGIYNTLCKYRYGGEAMTDEDLNDIRGYVGPLSAFKLHIQDVETNGRDTPLLRREYRLYDVCEGVLDLLTDEDLLNTSSVILDFIEAQAHNMISAAAEVSTLHAESTS